MRLLHCLTCQLDWNKNHSINLISILSGGKTEWNLFHLILKMNNVYFMRTNSFFMKFCWMFLLSLKRIFSWITMIFIFQISYLFIIFVFLKKIVVSHIKMDISFHDQRSINRRKANQRKYLLVYLSWGIFPDNKFLALLYFKISYRS